MSITPYFPPEAQDREVIVPRPVLLAAAALAVTVILLAGVSHRTGVGRDAAPLSRAVATRPLDFVDQPDGGVLVVDPGTGRDVAVLEPGTGGFVRGVLRALVRERRQSGVSGADDGPGFVLTRWQDGRLTLDDAATGRRIELTSFGSANQAAFAALLTAPAR